MQILQNLKNNNNNKTKLFFPKNKYTQSIFCI